VVGGPLHLIDIFFLDIWHGGKHTHVHVGLVLQVLELELSVHVDGAHQVGVLVKGYLGRPVADDLLAVDGHAGQTLFHHATFGATHDEPVVLDCECCDEVVAPGDGFVFLSVLVSVEVIRVDCTKNDLFAHLVVEEVGLGGSETPTLDFLLGCD